MSEHYCLNSISRQNTSRDYFTSNVFSEVNSSASDTVNTDFKQYSVDRERYCGFSKNDALPDFDYDGYLEEMVTEIIRKTGIPANIKGYHFIREAVIMSVKDMSYLDAITKRLYADIAKRNKTTPSRVERAIRHAIDSAWTRGFTDKEYVETVLKWHFNTEGARPTNSEFIALISDSLKLIMKAKMRNRG